MNVITKQTFYFIKKSNFLNSFIVSTKKNLR